MSRHTIEIPYWPPALRLSVGWDEGLKTYFALVMDRSTGDTLLWVGAADVIGTVDELIERINTALPDSIPLVTFSASTRHQLEYDRIIETTTAE